MTDWQPIDTAPKDGTVILICACETGMLVFGQRIAVAKFHAEHDFPRGKVLDFVTADEGERRHVRFATHWMPLPAPPKKGDGTVFPTVLEFYDGLPETWDEAAKLGTVTKDEFEKIASKCFDSMLEARKEKK